MLARKSQKIRMKVACRNWLAWLITGLQVLLIQAIINDEIDPSSLSLLRNVRDQIKFPEYSTEERQDVVQQAQKLMTMYTNRELKMERYGEQVDPIPRLNSTYNRARNLTDEDFHMEMFSTFSEYVSFNISQKIVTVLIIVIG